ncbi:aminotransferase class IV [Candidatus Pelagibacter sp.]|nr:aminotransferase class IV [Candidatus Pelagibacter sp.]
MVTYLLKKSYQHKTLKEIKFNDLWGENGVFTTMWIFSKPAKILFFKKHIINLVKSLKAYKLNKPNIEKNILKLIKINIDKNKSYNHLLRIAVNNKMISISLRKRLNPKLKFNLKIVKYKRTDPKFKNLKYKFILKHLSKMDNSISDIGLTFNQKIFESGTSNILFIKDDKIYSPKRGIYKGINYNFFKKKLGNIIEKDIQINSLNIYNEILLIGSGKGVASIQAINSINWKRKSFKFYRILFNLYKKEIVMCPTYK